MEESPKMLFGDENSDISSISSAWSIVSKNPFNIDVEDQHEDVLVDLRWFSDFSKSHANAQCDLLFNIKKEEFLQNRRKESKTIQKGSVLKGNVALTNMTVSLSHISLDFSQEWFVMIFTSKNRILATEVTRADMIRQRICFADLLKFKCLDISFVISVELYRLVRLKKSSNTSMKKKCLKLLKMSQVCEYKFELYGACEINFGDVNKLNTTQFSLFFGKNFWLETEVMFNILEHCIQEGNLMIGLKRGTDYVWKKYYCKLEGCYLKCYRDSRTTNLDGVIDLKCCSNTTYETNCDSSKCNIAPIMMLVIETSNIKLSSQMIPNKPFQTYNLMAETTSESLAWKHKLQLVIDESKKWFL